MPVCLIPFDTELHIPRQFGHPLYISLTTEIHNFCANIPFLCEHSEMLCLRKKRNKKKKFNRSKLTKRKKKLQNEDRMKKPVACAVLACTESFAIGTDF